MDEDNKINDIMNTIDWIDSINFTKKKKIPKINKISKLVKPFTYNYNLDWKDSDNFKILCLTWNLSGLDGGECFNNILNNNIKDKIDIICLSTQESCNSIFKSFFNNNKEKITSKYKNILEKKFNLITNVSMNALNTCIFLNKKYNINNIKNLYSFKIKRGFKGLLSNKGCLTVKFDFKGKNFLFANLHIASGINNELKRQMDLKLIFQHIFYGLEAKEVSDIIFLLGDFNFRVSNTDDKIKKTKISLKELLSYDEYNYHKKYTIFPEFKEKKINFPPSYKYVHNTNILICNKKTFPSWCDRIFYYSNKWDLECIKYDMLIDEKASDHKPIIGYFEILNDEFKNININ